MGMSHRHAHQSLHERFPPSAPCDCEICRRYCARPGWWTVAEARKAIAAEYAGQMMLEIAPECTFGVLSPAFKGCEGYFGLQTFSQNGCTFLQNGLCQLHATGFEPLECCFCHHSRLGQGQDCHTALERDWNTLDGRELVISWMKLTNLWSLRRFCCCDWME